MAYGASATLSLGAYLSVVCSEDVPFIDASTARRAGAGTFLGDTLSVNLREACRHRPTRERSNASQIGTAISAVPTLIISGDIDPATPPRWGDTVMKGLSRGKHVVLAGTGHIPSLTACASRVIAQFIKVANAETLDTSCAREQFSFTDPSASAQRAVAGVPTPSKVNFSGTWDLYWSTEPDAKPSGYLVITQEGDTITVQVRGQGEVDAAGSVKGSTFHASGRRITTFDIEASMEGSSLVGTLKVLTVVRAFRGVRRM